MKAAKTRESREAELVRILSRYDELSSNSDFAKDCRTFGKLDAVTGIGDRRTAEAAVDFYLKWEVYPIPHYLLNDHNLRVSLEQLYIRDQRVVWIPISPLTTLRNVIDDFRDAKRKICAPSRVPNLTRFRVTLLYAYLIHRSSFHGFKASDFATAFGSKSKKGKSRLEKPPSGKELDDADRLVKDFMKQGDAYPSADNQAMRRVLKRRWREAKATPKIRMAIRRALPSLEALVRKPNI